MPKGPRGEKRPAETLPKDLVGPPRFTGARYAHRATIALLNRVN
jgi:hypothetical protein